LTIWKKAVSTGLTATLLASLLATAAATSVFAAADNTPALDCAVALDTTTCSQVADGASIVTLEGVALTDTLDGTGSGSPDAGTLVVTVDAPAFTSAAGFTLSSSNKTATFTFTGSNDLSSSDTLTLTAPTIAGTTTVTVVHQSVPDPVTGLVTTTPLGSLTVSWISGTNLNVSEANSRVKIVASSGLCTVGSGEFTEAAVSSAPASPAGASVAKLCVLVKNGAGSTVPAGTTVGATITPVGLLTDGSITGQNASTTTNSSGVASLTIKSSGLAGVATIAITVTQGTTTTSFAPKTFTFSGSLATLALDNLVYSLAPSASTADVASVTAKDAAGNTVACPTSATVTDSAGLLTGEVVTTNLDGDCVIQAAAGSVKGSTTLSIKSGSISSNAITIYVAGTADSFTVAFDKTSVAPGATATVTVTIKDADGRPIPDSSGAGVTVTANSGALLGTGAVSNGKVVYTFLAPFNTGVATVVAAVSGVTGTQSASINIGAVVTSGTAASALGVTTSGPFTTTTKTPAIGKYVTVKLSFGSSAAGQTVEIWTASKSSSGVWSAFTVKTSRIANSNGDVYFYWKSSSAAWLSIRGKLGSAYTNAVQVRWM